jgi:1-aminocyclopropane-1-carboxylate deaminase
MKNKEQMIDWLTTLPEWPRVNLTHLPTPIQHLNNFEKQLGGPELWIKRDDMTGLPGGGNKTRKLEFLMGDAVKSGADMVVTVGAIQSNHTRQTAAAAAKCGLKCALMHCCWTKDAGPYYRHVGNILMSSLFGAELYLDDRERPIEDQGPMEEFMDYLQKQGHNPYLIPAGGSEHPLGSLGYIVCAAEIIRQSKQMNISFDYILHTSGSSSTQAGLVAGFAALGEPVRVIGVADDFETDIKKRRVLQLANESLELIGVEARLKPEDIEIISGDHSVYGVADQKTIDTIRLFARTEGLLTDPVYEGKALRGLLQLSEQGRFEKNCRILLMHLGGVPGIDAYANQFPEIKFKTMS